jgi:16S rRNA G966 N2-methylase RsmD
MLNRKIRFSPEAELERNFVDLFSGAGSMAWRQVPCPAGRADVVTKHAIVECKDKLTRTTLQQAIGQLHLYKVHINPYAQLAILCNLSRVPHMHEHARKSGVAIFEWQDVKQNFDVILSSPPFSKPRRKR